MTSSTPPGASKPRVEGHPPFTATLGDLAIELARRAGLILDPWQQDSLRIMMAVNPDGTWVCPEFAEWVPRQNGKGALLEARVLAGFLLLGEQLIMWSAHEFKTANREFRRMRRLIRKLGVKVKDDGSLWDIAIGAGKTIRVKITSGNDNKGFERLDTEAQVQFIARSKDSGRGFDGDLNIIDEAYAMTAEQQDSLQPTMRAKPNPQVVYVSTPPLTGDTGEIMYALRARAEAGDFEELGYRDWGLAGDLDHLEGIDLDDRANWLAANPACPGRITLKAIARDRRTMVAKGGRGFARECLGIWPRRQLGGGSIDPAQWASLQDPTSRRHGDVALAVDISPSGDYAAIGLFGLRADGLGHWQLLDYRPGIAWVVGRVVAAKQQLNPLAIAMGRGTAAVLEVALAKEGITRPADPERPGRGDLAVATATDMGAATRQALDAIREATVRVRPDEHQPEILDAAAAAAKTQQGADSVAWSRKDMDVDVDVTPIPTLSLARGGFYVRVDAIRSTVLEGSLMA